jgi:hypothetical protein
MLISELKKYIQAVLINEAYNPSTSRIPIGLINDVFYNIHDNVLPTIFDFLLSNHISLNELFSNNAQYAIQLQQKIQQSQQHLVPFYDIIIEDSNWDFLNQELIKNKVLKSDSVRLEIGYYHYWGCLWDTVNQAFPEITAEDIKTAGFCNFIEYDKNQQEIGVFIAINLSHFLVPELLDLYENDQQQYLAIVNKRNQSNNELRITIRHELEHYYQYINYLLYQVRKEAQTRLKYGGFVNIVNDYHNMIEHYILLNEVGKGFGFATIKTDYLRSKKNPFKVKSDFSMSEINRTYLYDEAEIPNHINDFSLLFTSYARYVFNSSADALLWLKDFVLYLKGCNMIDVEKQMWEYLNTGLWYSRKVAPHPNVLAFFENGQINVWDVDFKNYIGRFINNLCRASKFLLFLHELFSDTNTIQQALRKELVDVNKYIKQFKKVKIYVIEKLNSKVHKLWDDQYINPLEN